MTATKEDVLKELTAIAFSNVADFLSWDELKYTTDEKGNLIIQGGLELVPSKKLLRTQTAAISKIKQTEKGCIEFTLWNKMDALKELAKHLGIEGIGDDPMEIAMKIQRALSGMDQSVEGFKNAKEGSAEEE